MADFLFHSGLNKDDFILLLEKRFHSLHDPIPKLISDIETALGKQATRGRPVNSKTLKLFKIADTERHKGATLEAAIDTAMGALPDVKPQRRHTRAAGHDDPDHVKEMLIAEFKRYLSRKKHGLDPAIQYSRNIFFEFILTKQWDLAAAVFHKANKQRRSDLCERLNKFALKNTE